MGSARSGGIVIRGHLDGELLKYRICIVRNRLIAPECGSQSIHTNLYDQHKSLRNTAITNQKKGFQ